MKKTFFSAFIDILYKKNLEDSSRVAWFTAALVVLTYVLVNFRSPLNQLSPVRDNLIHQFISETLTSKQFDAQAFWRLRDQLGAVVTYNPEFIETQSIFELKEIPNNSVLLFEYTAPGLHSQEYVVFPADQSHQLPQLVETEIYSDESTRIFTNSEQHTVTILQNYAFEEMKKNNGMIDYQELKQNLHDRMWVTQTVIAVSPNFDFENL